MANSKGKKTSLSGYYWCNFKMANGSFKLAVGKKISEEDGIAIFQLRTNCSEIKFEPGFEEISNRPGWYQKEFLEEEVNEFFDF